jgi:hypothetical protein
VTSTAPLPTVTTVAADADPAPAPARPRLAWRPVLLLAGGLALVHGIASAWYGAFGDELYFVAAGHRPAWGYADQPPLVPWLAAALDHLAPGDLVVLRLPATLASAGHVVLAALVAVELGGRRRAQLLAAAAVAISPFFLATGHLLATSTLDPVLWTLLLWLVVRWIRIDVGLRRGSSAPLRAAGHDRLLLAAAPVLAVALFGKFLVPVLVAGLAVGVLVAGPRRLLGRPSLWVALVLAAASTVPTLRWQAAHGWPQLRMGAVVAAVAGARARHRRRGARWWSRAAAGPPTSWAWPRSSSPPAPSRCSTGSRHGGGPGRCRCPRSSRPGWSWRSSPCRSGPRRGGWSAGTSSPRARSAGGASPPTRPPRTGRCRPTSTRTPRCSPGRTGTPRRSTGTGPRSACRPSTAVTGGSGSSARRPTGHAPRSSWARCAGPATSAARSHLSPHRDPTANVVINGDVPLALCTPRAPWSQLWGSIVDMH